jgi:hypothetical protein
MDWPQKNAKDHKENKQSKFLSMRSLCSFAANIVPKMKSFLNLYRGGGQALPSRFPGGH